MNEAKTIVEIFTDGACSGNPGPGGWAALLRYGKEEKEIHGSEPQTTNNRMEMMAIIQALETLKKPVVSHIHTDSRYVYDGMTQWIHKWKANGWKTADKKPVKNDDLWQRLDSLCKNHKVKWFWVRGHDGHQENERVDMLARKALIAEMVHQDTALANKG